MLWPSASAAASSVSRAAGTQKNAGSAGVFQHSLSKTPWLTIIARRCLPTRRRMVRRFRRFPLVVDIPLTRDATWLWTTQSVSALPAFDGPDEGRVGDDPNDAVLHE
jgi:hypothetical protein